MSNVVPQSFYDLVARELQAGPPIPGLWMRSVAETMGDLDKARAMYIRLRVEELQQIADNEYWSGLDEKRKRILQHAKKAIPQNPSVAIDLCKGILSEDQNCVQANDILGKAEGMLVKNKFKIW